MKDFSRSDEDLLLIRWLYTQRSDLVEEAQSAAHQNKNNLKKVAVATLQFLYAVVWANPKSFDGHSLVSDDSERHAHLTSGVVSGATLFNAVTNGPILFYSFRYIGLAPALSVSILLNIIILWWTNQSGTTAANKKHGNKVWSGVGIAAFLAMSTVQSVIAGVGAELLNNQEELSYIHAEQLVDNQIKGLEETASFLRAKDATLGRKCEEAKSTLETMKINGDPNYNNKFIDTYGGTYNQVNSGLLINEEAICAPTRLSKSTQKVQEAEQAKAYLDEQRALMRNDIELIQELDTENGSAIYQQHFTSKFVDGNKVYGLRSGSAAIALASENFWSSLSLNNDARNSEHGVNSSILFFALSVITSLSAVVIIIAHTCTLDTKMSRNSKVEESVKHWLEGIRRQYALRPEADKTQEEEKLLALFIDDYYNHGRCDYPVAQAVAKMSQKGVGLRLLQDGGTLLKEIDNAYESVDKASFQLNAQLSNANDQEALDTAIVKKGLAELTQGVIRLLSLSNRYAASVSFEGERKHYAIMTSLAEDLRSQLDNIKMTLYNNLVRYGVEASTREQALDDLRSYLVGLQGSSAELKELTQEAIKDKLIPIFGDDGGLADDDLS